MSDVSLSPEPQSRGELIALTVMVLGAVVWLGGTDIRAIIAFDLFETGTLTYKTWLPPDAERQTFHLVAQSALYTIVGYLVVLVSGTIFLFKTRLTFKRNGWLMMSAILFYMFVPVELYQHWFDVRMVLHERSIEGVINWFAVRTEAQSLLKARLSALQGVPIMALLCYYTIIVLAVWKPLRKGAAAKDSPGS
jgi:hypothetical protein